MVTSRDAVSLKNSFLLIEVVWALMVSRHEQQKIIIEATNNFMTEIFNVYKNFKYMIYLFNYFIEGFRKSIFMASIGKIEM
jgi:hypothetical protein